GAGPVAAEIELLSVQYPVNDTLLAQIDFDAMNREALDLVDVETLVDPPDQQPLHGVRLGPDLAMLTLDDLFGRHDQREHTERGLRERFRPRRRPRPDANLGLGLEMLPADLARAQPRSPNRAWSTATIAGPAVSVRKIRGPTPISAHPRSRASSTS